MINSSFDGQNINETIFNKGIYNDLDKIQEDIDYYKSYFLTLEEKLSKLVDDYEKQNVKNKKIKKTVSEEDEDNKKKKVRFEYQDKKGGKNKKYREGSYFLVCSKRRAMILKQLVKELEFETHTTTEEKIVSKQINEYSEKLVYLMNELYDKCNEYYFENLNKINEKYKFDKIHEFVSTIDVIKSCAKSAKQFGYCCPIIIENDIDNSFIDAKELRHPIIERLSINTNYVPNDIYLGIKEQHGILLFGLNASGKSSIGKAIALNIIMAQAGMYVSCKEFKYYPYKNIFTRISGDDNLFYGQSSFAIEMSELRNILKYADKNSLVIGDEVCRGTETVSGIAIVNSALERFSEKGANYLFATHLHQLNEMESIHKIDKLKIYHLSVSFSDEKIIYDRKLMLGAGESIYGLEVAKFLIDDNKFVNRAYQIRNNLINKPEYIVQPKTSKYNASVYVTECQIEECNKTYKDGPLDVHHILFQCNSNNDGLIEHVQKNVKSNLVVLCKEHHIAVHNKNLEISGYKDTTEGIKLDYRFIDNKKELDDKKKKRQKYDENDINNINKYMEKYNNKSYVIKKLKDELEISISLKTLNKILNNEY